MFECLTDVTWQSPVIRRLDSVPETLKLYSASQARHVVSNWCASEISVPLVYFCAIYTETQNQSMQSSAYLLMCALQRLLMLTA